MKSEQLCVLLHTRQGGAVGSEEPGERAVELVASCDGDPRRAAQFRVRGPPSLRLCRLLKSAWTASKRYGQGAMRGDAAGVNAHFDVRRAVGEDDSAPVGSRALLPL